MCLDEILNFEELVFSQVSIGEIIINYMNTQGMFSVLGIYHIFNLTLTVTELCSSLYSSLFNEPKNET